MQKIYSKFKMFREIEYNERKKLNLKSCGYLRNPRYDTKTNKVRGLCALNNLEECVKDVGTKLEDCDVYQNHKAKMQV